jgi:sugar phosphate isomerase/epimerase
MGFMETGMITKFEEGIEGTADKVKSLGLNNIQYLYLSGDGRTSRDVDEIKRSFGSKGIRITAVFCTYKDMDYSTIPRSIQTGGIVPIRYREERVEETKRIADLAKAIGATAVALHYGALPEDRSDSAHWSLVEVTRGICDYCQALGLTLNLETGEDKSDTLLGFIEDVKRPNLGINFDPANMILYGKGDPIQALQEVGDHVLSCHCKDATWSKRPGFDWGEEVPLGKGEVDVEAFIRALHKFGYTGPLTIERETKGEAQVQDVRMAKDLLETIKAKLR